ncbi:MAG: response regulator, partial [Nitrospiraceae bacterium]|nr:response regulator [Nitrospiraceae bacterium]
MSVILIVDDEPLQREILGNIMSDAGYETYTAPSGEDALEKAGQVHPDVVLTDLKMKKIDGIALLEKLKDDSGIPAVVIMTAFGSVSSAVEAMKKGASDYLTKPLDKEMVLLTVKRALNT